MKSLRKRILAMASVVAVSGLMMASVAGAADKLIVKDATGTTTVFKVDDTGSTTATKLGVGTTNPQTPFHNADSSTLALRGVMVAQHNDGAQAASIMFRKSRGTEAVPTQLILSDYIGLFQAQYWNGVNYDRAAQFGFRNDGVAGITGPVVAGSTTMPQAIMFYTGASTQAGDPNILAERLRISSTGNIVAGNGGGAATTDLPPTATNGFLYIPNVSAALTTCGTVTQYAGHVPVWFDTTNSKICTCQGTTLKCTAALN